MANTTILSQLQALKGRFDAASRDARKAVLAAATGESSDDPKLLRAYHDALLFMAAYPDDAETLQCVESELRRIAQCARAIADRSRAARRSLEGSGIAGTSSVTAFTLRIARWLNDRLGDGVTIDWSDDEAAARLETALPRLTVSTERDGLRNDGYDTQAWVGLARGGKGHSDLAWLLDRVEANFGGDAEREAFYDSLDLPLRWQNDRFELSRTGARFPNRPIDYQTDALIRGVDARQIIRQPVRETKPLSAANAKTVLDAARATLCVRLRETDPVTYANLSEITLLELDRGIDVALIGMTPDQRLPIESYFGYVAARNRVPMAYGGGWVLGDRCEIGVNIFDEYRGGESAHLFSTILRAYHQYYRVTRFFVDPYQFGAGNPEAIASGAFWFYHRLGFRPVQPAISRLADEEAGKISAYRSYRSPPATLRRLAKSNICLDVERDDGIDVAPVAGEFDLAKLGTVVTGWIGDRFGGDIRAARKWAVARAIRVTEFKNLKSLAPAEQVAFGDLAMLIGPLSEIEQWSASDRRSLGRLMQSKGGVRERDYARRVQSHPRFLPALASLAKWHGALCSGLKNSGQFSADSQ